MSIRARLAREGREAYTAVDLKTLSPEELLACLLRSEESAQALCQAFPSPSVLASADLVDLTAVPGISWARAEQIAAAFELAARLRTSDQPALPVIQKPQDAVGHLTNRFRGLKKEVFVALLLSTRNRVLRTETVSEGSLNASIVHPREVFRPAILSAAASIIVAHNHPSGDPSPSDDDLAITRRLVEAGETLGIAVLDHVIVSGERFYSFKEEGHL